MTTRTQQWIAELNTNLLNMSSLVEESLRTAMTALVRHNADLAKRVREHDDRIDALDNEIRDHAIKTLALQQPVGGDLRFLVSSLNMISELERVGDNALNIANRVLRLCGIPDSDTTEMANLQRLGDIVEKMLAQAINSFVYQDTELARAVSGMDLEANELYAAIESAMRQNMTDNPGFVAAGLDYGVIALNLERIGDQAKNLAEEVVFLVEGQNIRHKPTSRQAVPTPFVSPLESLEKHAQIVNECLELARRSLERYTAGDMAGFAELAQQVNQKEHEADSLKRNVRGHLPRGVILPIDKFELFAFLREQDRVADDSQTLIDWLSLMECSGCAEMGKTVHALFDKCMEASKQLPALIREARTFFKKEDDASRNQVKQIIFSIRQLEHDADALEMSLKHLVFKRTKDPIQLHHQLTTIDLIGGIADHAENAADMMRAMIAR